MVEITRELLEVEPEDVTELLQSHDKTLKDEKLLLKTEQRKGFFKVVTTPDKDAIEFFEMTTKDFKYYINLVDKAAAGCERIDSDFQTSSPVGKMASHSVAHYREIFCEKNNQSIQQTSLLPYFKKLPQPPQTSATTTLIGQQPSISKQEPLPVKDYNPLKTQMMVSIFLSKKICLIQVLADIERVEGDTPLWSSALGKDTKKNLRSYLWQKGRVGQTKRGTGTRMMRYRGFQDKAFTYSSRWA